VSNLFLTLVIAFIIIVIAIAALAIGWLITGRTKLQTGSCGRHPSQNKDQNCNEIQSCNVCQPCHEEKNELDNGKNQF
jgi:hypothetical protein